MTQQIPNSLPTVNKQDQSFKKIGEEKRQVFHFLRTLLPTSGYGEHNDSSRRKRIQGNTKSTSISLSVSLAMKSDHER